MTYLSGVAVAHSLADMFWISIFISSTILFHQGGGFSGALMSFLLCSCWYVASLLLVDDESDTISDNTASGHNTDESQVTFSMFSGYTVKSMFGIVGVDSDLHISGVDVCTLAAFTLLLVWMLVESNDIWAGLSLCGCWPSLLDMALHASVRSRSCRTCEGFFR